MTHLQSWALALLLAAASLLGTATNNDTEADQLTADTVAERGAEAAQIDADALFAEVAR